MLLLVPPFVIRLLLFHLLLLFLPLLSLPLLANFNEHDSSAIERFLLDVSQSAIDLKIIEAQAEADSLRNKIDLGQFDVTARIGAKWASTKDPPTSPFSSEKTLKRNYSASLSKLWQSGISSSLNYELLDNFTGFPTRTDQDYYNPELSLGLSTSLFRDLFSSRHNAVPERIQFNEIAIQSESKIKQKAVLVRALVTLAEILELQDDLKLQTALCENIHAQKNKLAARFKRGSIRRRDYLLSRQEDNNCAVSTKNLRKLIKKRKEELSVTFKVDPDSYKSINVDGFFREFRQLCESPEYSPSKVDFEASDDLIALRAKRDASTAKQVELDALKKPDLAIEFKTSLSGLKNNIGKAHSDIADTDYKLLYGSITLAFPFTPRSAEINAAANRMNTVILENRVQKLKDERRSQFKKLQFALEQDMSSYQNYKENVELSQKILKDAQRDFNNGRIDFFSLTEFQKSLIQSQQRLASLRRSIVLQTVEYIDFFQYFDRFNLGAAK